MSQSNPRPQVLRRVSQRDRRIYYQVMVAGRSQRQVAEEHQLSPARVSQILDRVDRWYCAQAPVAEDEGMRAARQHAAIREYRAKLKNYEAEAREAFAQSKQDWKLVASIFPNDDGTPGFQIRGKVKFTQRSSPGDIGLLRTAQGFAEKLANFDVAALASEVVRLPTPTPPNQSMLHSISPGWVVVHPLVKSRFCTAKRRAK